MFYIYTGLRQHSVTNPLLQAREDLVYKNLVKPETQALIQEIAFAMFRVASVAKHEGVKSSLENLAAKLAAEESLECIRRAENLIILGRETGDIKEVNAAVLLRELTILKNGLFVAEESEVDIRPIFNKPAPLPNPAVAFKSAPKPQSKSAKVSDDGLVKPSIVGEDISSKRSSNGVKKHNSISSDKIFEYIKEHRVARLKELEAAFKEVSGRTVRRITDSLIKDGRIERVGNPGPTSFYRPKIVIPHTPLSVPSFSPSVVIPPEIQSLSQSAPTSIITL